MGSAVAMNWIQRKVKMCQI